MINCQRNLISKMADKNDLSQGKRILCDFLNNLSSVDLFYEEKSWNETSCKKLLGLYSVKRLIATKQYAAVPFARGGHLGIFWVGMCRPGLQIGTPF